MEAGQVLAERYELVEELGRGGMSVVWRAHDLVLDRDVAVKVLAGSKAADPLRRQAIRAEAQIAARITHPHVAGVYDFGESVSESGRVVPFVVMELLRGRSLHARLAAGPVPVSTTLRICAEVAGALAAAHARDLVHRDVKPSNVMLVGGRAKVFDFGIAAAVGTLDDPGPDAPMFGTPGYVAPERLLGAPVNAASDVYALGLLLYRVLTGEMPWPARSAAQVMMAHVYAEPAPLPKLPGVPDSVVRLYVRCVAKDPGQRPTAREACLVLAAAAGIRAPLGDEGDETGSIVTVPPVVARSRRGWVAAGLAGAAVILLSAAVVAAILGGDHNRADSAEPATTGGTPSPDASAGPSATSGSAPPGTGAPIVPEESGTPSRPVPTSVPATTPSNPTPLMTSTSSAPRTFTSSGGSVTAVCYDTRAFLTSWTPAQGYTVKQVNAGPTPRARVMFQAGTAKVQISVSCANGEPVPDIQAAGFNHRPG